MENWERYAQPAGCYFSKIPEFLEIVCKSSAAGYENHSPMNNKFESEILAKPSDNFLRNSLMKLKLILKNRWRISHPLT